MCVMHGTVGAMKALDTMGAAATLSLTKPEAPFPCFPAVLGNRNIYQRLVLSCGTALE
jgi:hypothetical protein